jgi:choline dehydrogenase-like flavoprotein
MNDPVDVLIIGAGASGAAVAWSLAETRMHILCLEQGKEILRRRGQPISASIARSCMAAGICSGRRGWAPILNARW